MFALHKTFRFALPLFFVIGGCVAPSTEMHEPAPAAAVPVLEPTEAELLVLDFLNDSATDSMVLDVQVGINRRGAMAIIEHRDGPDGVYPSYDDDPFNSLLELEHVMHVGPVTIQTLVDFTAAQAARPGVAVEGVHFAPHEAANVLWGINRSTIDELRYEVGLAEPTAQALAAAPPASDCPPFP